MLNIIFTLAILIAYVYFNAKKAKQLPLDWVGSNVITTIVIAVLLFGALLVPKPVLAAALAYGYMPVVLVLITKWGVASFISNAFTYLSTLAKNLLK